MFVLFPGVSAEPDASGDPVTLIRHAPDRLGINGHAVARLTVDNCLQRTAGAP